MKTAIGLFVGVAALAPSMANAACEPSFVSSSALVSLTPTSIDDGPVLERFLVEIRNSGDQPCSLRLGVGRDLSALDAGFPAFTLSGPTGTLQGTALSFAAESGESRTTTVIQVPANDVVRVPYDVRLTLGWGVPNGDYEQPLTYRLYTSETQQEIASQVTRLRLNVPSVARIRFAGTGAADGPLQLQMGALSPTSQTQSPPFAIRVFSTSAYRIEMMSQNQGALKRLDGPDLIPYRLVVDRQPFNLAGGGDSRIVTRHTGPTGQVHQLKAIVDPDPTRHAGDYSDRVTVTVTPI